MGASEAASGTVTVASTSGGERPRLAAAVRSCVASSEIAAGATMPALASLITQGYQTRHDVDALGRDGAAVRALGRVGERGRIGEG